MPDIYLQPERHRITPGERESFLAWLRDFLGERRTLVLATCSSSSPVCNLMSFALADEECSLLLATPVQSRKYETLLQNPAVSLMALDSAALEQDLERGTAVTLEGEALELREEEQRSHGESIYLAANPRLQDFVQSSGTALFRVSLHRVVRVTSFQQLSELTL